MVNTGKPSQGCGTCRARRIKCDERKPTCFRCQKSKRECTGYRDTAFVRMRWDRGSRASKNIPSPPPSAPFANSNRIQGSSVSPSYSARSFNSQSWTTSPTQVRFRISVSPSSGIGTPIEDQVKCLFRRNFVLEPCEGNSRSYMGFTVPVLEQQKTLRGNEIASPGGKGESKLAIAVMASGLALLGNRPSSRHLMPKAMKCYSRALKEINEALLVEREAVEDDTLGAIILLGLFEVLTGTSGQPSGWISHADGAAILVKMRDEKKTPLTDLGRVLTIMARSQLVVNCLVSCSPPILGVTWWMRFGTQDVLPSTCARLNLSVATLHARCNAVLTSSTKASSQSQAAVLAVLNSAKELEAQFKAWEEALPRMWKYIISAWIDDHSSPGSEGLEGIEDLKAFPGRMDEYVDISIATAYNMMRASRIMLQGDIVRASAYLCPAWQDYRIMEEYNDAVRVSKGLIEDIIASIPYFLGAGEVTSRQGSVSSEGNERGKGNWRGKRPERSFVGTSALGLFVTWPLMMVKMSDYSSERQRRWAEGRLRFIADELGIGQALMFSKAYARLPSMFIARDEFAQVHGVEVAKTKAIELAMAENPNKSKELERLLSGLLGCKAV